MSASRLSGELPAWVLPLVIVVGALALVAIGVKAFTSSNAPPGPPREVHAGMFDFRKEVVKGNVGRRH
jgi:hypothetical protein